MNGVDGPQAARKASLGIQALSQNRTLDRAAAAAPVAKWDICTARICQHRFTGILEGGFSVAAFERCADVSGYRSRLVVIDCVSSRAEPTPTVYLLPATSWPGS